MESIEEVIWPALGLVFLLLGIVLVVSILFSSFNPYDQIAFANTEKLRAAIDEACVRNSDVTLQSFELKQNVPFATWIFPILPKWLIKGNGDSNYVIYYESFPPGEAVGWEVYHDFENRIITYLPEGFAGKGAPDVENFVKHVIETHRNANKPGTVDTVVIGNIMLSEDFRSDYILKSEAFSVGTGGQSGGAGGGSDFQTGGKTKERTTAQEKFFGFGKWGDSDPKTGTPAAGDNRFRFNNYLGLTNLEKTLVKYEFCGENALCLKTRSGVYRYELNHCKNIKNIEIIYDARANGWVRGGIETVTGVAVGAGIWYGAGAISLGGLGSFGLKFIGFIIKHPIIAGIASTITAGVFTKTLVWASGYFMSYKTSDLAISSPCLLQSGSSTNEKITIRKTDCSSVEWQRDADYSPCTRKIEYPVYQYDKESQKLGQVIYNGAPAYHSVCAEKTDYSYINEPDRVGYSGDTCIQIIVPQRASGFCWTPDPWKDSWASDTQLITRALGLSPVRDSTGYMKIDPAAGSSEQSSAFVLKPYNDKILTDFLSRWEKKLSWGWPGGLGQ